MVDAWGRMPLTIAIDSGSNGIIEVLLDRKAKVNYLYSIPWQEGEAFQSLSQEDKQRAKARHYIVEQEDFFGNPGGYEYQGKSGAERLRAWEQEQQLERQKWRRTPLLRAVEKNNKDAVELLLKSNASPAFGDDLPFMPLEQAAQEDDDISRSIREALLKALSREI